MADTEPLRLVPPDPRANAARRRALSRRTFVGVSLAAAGTAWATRARVARATSWTNRDPFRLGIASGDPTSTGVVLWTRLAVDPLAEDGLGGMPTKDVTVSWQLATDEHFANVIRAGAEIARPSEAHSVHVEVENLRPGAEYFYRFRVNQQVSDTARTRTLPAPGTTTTPLHAIALSCSHYEAGCFTAYHHAAAEEPDLIFALGDYIYEGAGVDGRPRKHPTGTCVTLPNYRARYALYKNEPETQEAHRAAPFIATWDDHEVADNWAGIYPKNQVPSDAFQARRAAAAQADYENMPLRRTSKPNGPPSGSTDGSRGAQLPIWTSSTPGSTAIRRPVPTAPIGGSTTAPRRLTRVDRCSETSRSDGCSTVLRTLPPPGRSWPRASSSANVTSLKDRPRHSAQTVGMATKRAAPASGMGGSNAASETPSCCPGDVHKPFANEIKANFDDPDSATVGVEFVTTAITSTGDGTDNPDTSVMIENPHIKYRADRRGYLSLRVDQQQLRAGFAAMPYVSKPGAPISIAKSFVVPAGDPGSTTSPQAKSWLTVWF